MWTVSALYLGLVATLLTIALRANNGKLVYSLDDAYIHMAMAKNFTQYGVWGVTAYGFTSATSSPGWTLLLSLSDVISGVSDFAPLLLNMLCALALLALVYRAFAAAPFWYRLFVLLAVLFVTPLLWLTFTGMEHLLHTLLLLALLFTLNPVLQNRDSASPRLLALSLLLAACATFVRYESLFVIGPLAVLLALRGRWRLAVGLTAAALLPIVLYGVMSLANGWYFVPNSLLVKTEGTFYVDGDAFNYWLFSVFVTLARQPHLLVLFGAAVVLWLTQKDQRGLLGVFIAALLLHLRFAGVGVNFRYEAYLVALGIVLIARALQPITANIRLRLPRPEIPHTSLAESRWVTSFLFLTLIVYAVLPLLRRAIETLQSVVPATTNIYQQQYQMGEFLREFGEGDSVVLNDIGAVSYLADVRIIDVVGLASMEVARARQAGEYTPQRIGDISANASIAIVYNAWLRQGVPAEWHAVGNWQVVTNNVVLGDTTVTFYAINPYVVNRLTASLLAYSSQLPANVIQSGEYTALLDLYQTLDVLPADRAFWTNAPLREVFGVPTLVQQGDTRQLPDVLVIDEAFNGERPSLEQHTLYNTLTLNDGDAPLRLEVYLRQPQELAQVAAFSENISLRAWRLRSTDDDDDTSVLPCDRVILESWWQNTRPLTLDYSITLSLFGDAAGIVFTDRAPPLATLQWQPEMLYADVRALDIPCDMPRGDYPLALGIHSADGQFLPVGGESFFVLTTLTVR